MKPIDITGMKYERLTALYPLDGRKVVSKAWVCLCDCGNFTVVNGLDLRRKVGTSGKTYSCGCLFKERTGATHRMSETPVYAVWLSMKGRCLRKTDKYWKHYGGRGIKVCKRWMKFENFYKDMGEPNGLTLDRINNNGDYKPSNCRWATWKVQANNKKR